MPVRDALQVGFECLVVGPVREAHSIREQLRGAVEKLRDRKRVREIDYS